MITEHVIDEHINYYIQKLEQKYQIDSLKIKDLQNKLKKSAIKIQTAFRRYILKKKIRCAIKIQRFWKKILLQAKTSNLILKKAKQVLAAYKIYYFLKNSCLKNKKIAQNKHKIKSKIQLKTNLLKKKLISNIIKKSNRFFILICSLQAEIGYIKKFQTYDHKYFVQTWKKYESSLIEKLWKEIKKKWVKKNNNIWINEANKQINAEAYVNDLIEKSYNENYSKFQKSQQRLEGIHRQIKQQCQGVERAYIQSIFYEFI